MNNNFREGLNALREISDPKLIKLALEKITGKKLADYEGVNALVGALMGYYNDEVKKKLTQGTVPNSLNSAEKIVAALKGNGGLKFDESLLYLNDAGTKKVGFMYLDKLTDGIFECISQTTTTVNNSSYFKNISNKNNSDRLDNLSNLSMFAKREKIFLSENPYVLDKGMYFVWLYHGGYSGMGKFFIISLSVETNNNRPDHPNAFIEAKSILDNESGNDTYNILYNPQTREVKVKNGSARYYQFAKLIEN